MATTTIKLSDAQTATKNINSKLNSQAEIINSYKGFISQLQENWSGEGYNSFSATFDKLSPNMKKMFENISDYNNQIIKLLEKMQETDNNSAKLFDVI